MRGKIEGVRRECRGVEGGNREKRRQGEGDYCQVCAGNTQDRISWAPHPNTSWTGFNWTRLDSQLIQTMIDNRGTIDHKSSFISESPNINVNLKLFCSVHCPASG